MLQYPLPPASVVRTPGFGMGVKHLALVVSPVYMYHTNAADLLEKCYTNVLLMAKEKGARKVSLPSLGTGGMGYPVGQASKVALTAMRKFLLKYPDSLDSVRIVCFEASVFRAFTSARQMVQGGFDAPLHSRRL